MNAPDSTSRAQPDAPPADFSWSRLVKKTVIWVLFLVAVYLASNFFLLIFLTFMLCYVTLQVVGAIMPRLGPRGERPWVRRAVTVAVLLLIPLGAVGALVLLGSLLVPQVQHLTGWLGQVDPETEVSRLVESHIGPSELQKTYGGPDDPRYQEALKKFEETGERFLPEYLAFPKIEDRVEGGFNKRFDDEEQARIRSRLASGGTSSPGFANWFLQEKYPQLKAQAEKELTDKVRGAALIDPLLRGAATEPADRFLEQVRREPKLLAQLRNEWVQETVASSLTAAKASPAYLEQFRAYYDQHRGTSPQLLPCTFDQYLELRKARGEGKQPFAEVMTRIEGGAGPSPEARLRLDFEAAKKHELFEEWWASSSAGRFLREQVAGRLGGSSAAVASWVESSLAGFLDLPITVATAFLLSLFICIDFPALRRGMSRLRDTWLRDAYDEVSPALVRLGHLIGRSFQAQAVISFCNALLMFLGLLLLGVEHALVLGLITFVLCLIPVVGVFLSSVPVILFALFQSGGGVVLALETVGLILVVHLIETFVLNPRIIGKMMEVHPVLVIAILPVSQYFFGIWGVILSTPVAVYLLYEVIFRKEIPGLPSTSAKPLPTPEPRAVAQETEMARSGSV